MKKIGMNILIFKKDTQFLFGSYTNIPCQMESSKHAVRGKCSPPGMKFELQFMSFPYNILQSCYLNAI